MEFQGETSPEEKRGFRERDAEQNRTDHNRSGYYTINIGPGDIVDVSAGYTNFSNLVVVNFSTGVDDTVRFGIPKPELWRNGKVKVRIFWATNGTDADDCEVDFDLWGVTDEALAAGKDTLYTGTLGLTPTGTSLQMQEESFFSTADILDEHKIVCFEMTRTGTTESPVNSNTMGVYGWKLEFNPNHRQ
jgi:hypothetical protein